MVAQHYFENIPSRLVIVGDQYGSERHCVCRHDFLPLPYRTLSAGSGRKGKTRVSARPTDSRLKLQEGGRQLSLRSCRTVKQSVPAVAQLVPGWRKDATEDGVNLVELAVKIESARNC